MVWKIFLKEDQETVLIGEVHLKPLGYMGNRLWSKILNILLNLGGMTAFTLLKKNQNSEFESELELESKERKEEEKCIVVCDNDPRHIRERILSCRAWIGSSGNGDYLHHVYKYYNVLEHMVKAMENIQSFVQIKSIDSVEAFQAKFQLKMDK